MGRLLTFLQSQACSSRNLVTGLNKKKPCLRSISHLLKLDIMTQRQNVCVDEFWVKVKDKGLTDLNQLKTCEHFRSNILFFILFCHHDVLSIISRILE